MDSAVGLTARTIGSAAYGLPHLPFARFALVLVCWLVTMLRQYSPALESFLHDRRSMRLRFPEAVNKPSPIHEQMKVKDPAVQHSDPLGQRSQNPSVAWIRRVPGTTGHWMHVKAITSSVSFLVRQYTTPEVPCGHCCTKSPAARPKLQQLAHVHLTSRGGRRCKGSKWNPLPQFAESSESGIILSEVVPPMGYTMGLSGRSVQRALICYACSSQEAEALDSDRKCIL
eukprot:scaffold64896_cov33-Tisochrysis_lutea.AAC.2